jgi:hypothetical protein
MSLTYFVVVPFDRDDEGDLKPGEAREAANAAAAMRHARSLSYEHAGAVAFSRVGDSATGEFEATVLAQFGAVDLEALAA